MNKPRILILGGTTEARKLAERLEGRSDLEILISLAGRTADPKPLPLPTRIGGFGGAEGLADFLRTGAFDLMIDATHPFAEQISANAARAAEIAAVPIFALRRPGWQPVAGDRWHPVLSIDAAVDALGAVPRRVFLAIGRQEAHRFSRAPQHYYLVRSVDPLERPLLVPHCDYILAGGPFDEADETRLLKDHAIDCIVTKNSGGAATYAKIAAARALGLDVIVIERKPELGVPIVASVDQAVARIDHVLPPA